MSPSPAGAAICFENISKQFGGTHALQDVSFEVERGTVHALLGGNGSGKSTLIKILSGVYHADHGWIEVNGNRHSARTTSPEWARENACFFVHQGSAIFPELSVADNFALSSTYDAREFGPINNRALYDRASDVLERFGIDVEPHARMGDLSLANQTMIAVARALGEKTLDEPGILVFDEPTAALPVEQQRQLLDGIKGYRTVGHTVIIVTHRLEEVEELADRVTFLRDGRHLETVKADTIDTDLMIHRIAGIDLDRSATVSTRPATTSTALPRLVVDDLHTDILQGVSFDAPSGEIVGLATLSGAGHESLMLSLFGVTAATSGEAYLDGGPHRPRNPQDAIAAGVAYVPAERQRQAIFPDLPVRSNLSLSDLWRYWRAVALSRLAESSAARHAVANYSIVAASTESPISSLSGGNQQKVVIARWLEMKPRLLLLDEPTQGVDVGARAAIHDLLHQAAGDGATIVVASSDPEELAELSHRVIGLVEGHIGGEIAGEDITASRCVELAFGRTNGAAAQDLNMPRPEKTSQ